MPANRAQIIVDARDEASMKLYRIQEALQGLSGETVRFGSTAQGAAFDTRQLSTGMEQAEGSAGGLQGILGGVTQQIVALGAAYVGVKGLRMAHDLALVGAQAEMTEQSFERMTASVGVSADILDRMKRAAGGTIPELQLMQALNTSLIGTSREFGQRMAEAYPQLVEIARAASIANPALGDTDFMIRSLSIGLKRMSPLIIDNLGLQVKLGDANKAYAAQLGKTVNELTTEEKQMALLNDTLRAGRILVDQVGLSSENAAIQHQALGAAFADTRVEIGKSLDFILGYQGTLTKLVQGVGGLVGRMNEADDVIAKFSAGLRELRDAGKINTLQFVELAVKGAALQAQVIAGTKSVDQMEAALFGMTKGLDAGGDAFDEFNPKLKELAEWAKIAGEQMEYFTGGLAITEAPALEDQLRRQAGLWNDYYTELRTRTMTFVDTRNAIEYGGWEDLWNYIEQGDEQARRRREDEARRSAERSAREQQRIFESTVTDIEMLLRPTMPEDWWKPMLPREDAWDEWARRAASIAAEGWGSEWLSKLQALDPDFQKLLEEYGDPKVAAAVWIDEFYKGMHPEAVRIDRIVDQYNDMMVASINRRNLAEQIAAMVMPPEGVDVEPAAIEALLGGDQATAQAVISGQEIGQTLTTSLQETLMQPSYALQLVNALSTQFQEQQEQFRSLGVTAGEAMQEGVLAALTSAGFVGDLAERLAPEIFRRIQEWGWGRCQIQQGYQ